MQKTEGSQRKRVRILDSDHRAYTTKTKSQSSSRLILVFVGTRILTGIDTATTWSTDHYTIPTLAGVLTTIRYRRQTATRPFGARHPCAALCTCERDRVLHCVYFAWARMKRCVTDACPPVASRSRALPCLLLQSACVVTLGVARRVNQSAPLHVLRSSTTPARLTAACDRMRCHPRSSLERDENHPQAPATGCPRPHPGPRRSSRRS